jgi:hypothetical protein
MEERSVTAFAQLHQQTTNVPIADLQSSGSFALRDLLPPYLV